MVLLCGEVLEIGLLVKFIEELAKKVTAGEVIFKVGDFLKLKLIAIHWWREIHRFFEDLQVVGANLPLKVRPLH